MLFLREKQNGGNGMASNPIAWKTLEPALSKLKKDELLHVLRDAYEALPASRVVSFSASMST